MNDFDLLLVKYFPHINIGKKTNIHKYTKLHKNVFLFECEKQLFCIKLSTIINGSIFNKTISTLNKSRSSVYVVLKNVDGIYTCLLNGNVYIVYKYIAGNVLSPHEYLSIESASAIGCLHKEMNKIKIDNAQSPEIINILNSFEEQSDMNLLDFRERLDFSRDFYNKNISTIQSVTVMHGDLYSKNVIKNNYSLSFIDFERTHVYFKGYEIMRYLFISNIEDANNLDRNLHKILNFLDAYSKYCSVDFVCSFEIYLFTLCCEHQLELNLGGRGDNMFITNRGFLRKNLLSNFDSICNYLT